jgi:O-antigen/teichoic acid export membrane protein
MATERLSSKVVRGVGWNFVGVFGTLAINFIYTLVIARIVSPDDFGRLAFLLQLMATIILLSTMGFEYAINKFVPVHRVEGDRGRTVDMVRKMFLLKLGVILALSLILFFGSDIIAQQVFTKGGLSFYIKLVAIIIIPFGFEGIFRPLLVSYYEQKTANLSIVTARLLNLILATAMILALSDISGALYAELISWSLFLVIILIESKRKIFKTKVAPGKVNLRTVMKYSSFLYAYAIMNVLLGQQLDIILLGRFQPDAEIGFYFIGYNLSYLAVSIFNLALAGGITLTFFSELYAKKDYDGLRRTYTVFFEYNYFTIIPIAVGGILLGSELVELLYPAGYSAAVPILTIFFVSFCVIKLGGITSTFMSAMEKERALVASRTIFGITNLGLDLVLIPEYGAVGAAIATSIAGILGIGYESYVVHKLVSPRYPTRFLGKVLLASLVMGLVVLGAKVLLGGSVLGMNPIILLVPLGLVVYLAMTKLLKPVSDSVLEMMEDTKVPMRRIWTRLLR